MSTNNCLLMRSIWVQISGMKYNLAGLVNELSKCSINRNLNYWAIFYIIKNSTHGKKHFFEMTEV